ncbi:UPF0598 protein C8orf82 homolog [Phasianus colchicus]|uniref:UPF0598 protein C8orf82 homolog n=1 Tax=Phasianus colchicus TaxID=9054 RepID=UPI00129EBA45|nr:UPF0598 protein C8orf82 homolog [Phasianus colchicus]
MVVTLLDERFLAFFFRHLRPNRSGRYEDSFPFLSPCGAEHNFVRCQDLPIVFTRVLEGEKAVGSLLSYCGGGARLAIPFQPELLTFDPENGRLYHPGPEGGGGVGLVKSALVEEWGEGFEYGAGGAAPTHFVWGGRRYALRHPLLGRLRALRGGGRGGETVGRG